MMNVCWNCGLYRADKVIDPAGPFAECPACGHRHPFRQLPLFVISGASGAGKSTVCQALLGQMREVVVLDSDILWRDEFNTPKDNYRDFFETWLRMCKNIAQSGRPVVLCGAGFGVPANLEQCVERRYLAAIHILAFTCTAELLTERLRGRPAWRGCAEPGFIEAQLKFNQWFQAEASRPASTIEAFDTTQVSIADTVAYSAAWIRARLPHS